MDIPLSDLFDLGIQLPRIFRTDDITQLVHDLRFIHGGDASLWPCRVFGGWWVCFRRLSLGCGCSRRRGGFTFRHHLS